MKKTILLTTMLILALGVTACSKKTEETTAAPTTETTTEAVTEAATEETTEEEIEEEYMTGVIQKFTDTTLTILSDDDGSVKEYDITNAAILQIYPFSEGDAIELSYPEGNTKTPVPVINLEVIESVIGENTDPSVTGMVEDATMNSITLKLEDGNAYTFNTSNAYTVAKNGVLVDKEATVTFIGDVEDTDPIPLAVKVVMEDSYDSADAKLNAFIGSVVSIEDDSIVLESADGDFYTFASESIDFSSYKVDQTLKIFYEGTITAKEIATVKISKQ